MHEAFDLNIRLLVAVLKAFNEPGRSLQFVIEGSAGANARETPADRFGGIMQGG
jgi:hypothetical protein